MCGARNRGNADAVWLGSGLALLGIGIGGRPVFIGIGLAFTALGVVSLARRHRAGS